MSQFAITSPTFREDWPHCPHSEYGSAMETLSCPTWDKTWQSYWQTCIPTADTTLLTLDRTGQEYIYTHVQSNANDMTPPALSFPKWDIGQDSTVLWTCTTDMAVPPLLWCPSHMGQDKTVQWTYTQVLLLWTSHGKLGQCVHDKLVGIRILFHLFTYWRSTFYNYSLKNVHIIRIIKIITRRTDREHMRTSITEQNY